MKLLIKKIIKRIVLIALFIYVVSIFISQQKMLNSCAAEKSQYTNEIETAKAEKWQEITWTCTYQMKEFILI